MSSGKLYIRGGTQHIVIPNVRTDVRWKFDAGLWTDLRIGFFLSLTKASDDNDPTGLAESISNAQTPYDHYWIGLKSDGLAFPFAGATQFIGFTDNLLLDAPPWLTAVSQVVSSDIGLGTSNAYFWRSFSQKTPGDTTKNTGLIVVEQNTTVLKMGVGWEQHFPQDDTNAGGYSVALGFRLQRSDPTSTLFTVDVNANNTNDCALEYTDTTTEDALLALLETWPTSIRTSAQVYVSAMPTTIFLYWPFRNSRLRISARGMLRAR